MGSSAEPGWIIMHETDGKIAASAQQAAYALAAGAGLSTASVVMVDVPCPPATGILRAADGTASVLGGQQSSEARIIQSRAVFPVRFQPATTLFRPHLVVILPLPLVFASSFFTRFAGFFLVKPVLLVSTVCSAGLVFLRSVKMASAVLRVLLALVPGTFVTPASAPGRAGF